MKRAFNLIAVVAAVFLLASCSTVYRSAYSPDITMLNIEMSDLEFLGETQISVEYDTYLGIFRRIDKINGEKFDGKVRNLTSLHSNVPLARCLDLASYKVLEDYPKANYFIVANQKVTKESLFLGSEKVAVATVRAYRIK